jgi:hypothetical protein
MGNYCLRGFPVAGTIRLQQVVLGVVLFTAPHRQTGTKQSIALLSEKLIICALGNLQYQFSREKFESEPGFEARTFRSSSLAGEPG